MSLASENEDLALQPHCLQAMRKMDRMSMDDIFGDHATHFEILVPGQHPNNMELLYVNSNGKILVSNEKDLFD